MGSVGGLDGSRESSVGECLDDCLRAADLRALVAGRLAAGEFQELLPQGQQFLDETARCVCVCVHVCLCVSEFVWACVGVYVVCVHACMCVL